jgi:hypothetical protein
MMWEAMGEEKDPADDANVRVTIRPSVDATEDWENDFGDGGGPATTIDPDALKKLRLEDSAPDLSDLAAPILSAEESAEESVVVIAKLTASRSASPASLEALGDGAVDEFDDRSMTVMDSRSISERDASGDGLGPVGEPCPKCGVKVAPGYPKCPRCKAVLVQSNQAHKKVAGGTSVIGRTVPWTIVVIAAVLTAFIYYLAERDPRPEGVENDTSSESQQADTASAGGDTTAAEGAEGQDTEAANPDEL